MTKITDQHSITDYLAINREFVERHHKPRPDWKHQSYYGLILDEGRHWSPEDLADARVMAGVPKQCYKNAADRACASSGEYVYWEGWAWPKGLIPVEHAWVTDVNGVLVETTWRVVATEYVGVTFDDLTLRKKLVGQSYYGLLNNDFSNHEFLRYGVTRG
jgi:hypothetical protein